ncbi:MAG TPA: NapC/NirT family cytochrome c, partial [Polyangia bacterium]
MSGRWSRSWFFLAVLAGAFAGLGLFTFNYAAGTAYLSNDPAACANCHLMNDQFESWRKGPHHAVATCNDCHVPPQFPAKYVAKARNGYHHSMGITLQPARPDDPGARRVFEEPVRIKDTN